MSRRGVLLVNLGSPESASVPDVRRYLREFLMDRRVMDVAYPWRWLVVHGAILPRRPRRSAEAYGKIWTAEGSPLVATSRKVREELARRVGMPVGLAMRYRNPTIASAIGRLSGEGVDSLLLIPMFPHYAMSTFETVVERVREVQARVAPAMEVRVVAPYYDDPGYINALVASASEALSQPHDHVLFSYHGLPERHLRKTDPTGAHCLRVENCCEVPSEAHRTCYRAQCFRTTDAFVRRAGVTRYSVAFQSRLGREPWLRPYTDREIVRLARDGVRRLAVICPSFVADCLETLEEIGLRGREVFLASGGRGFTLIPCLNVHPDWIAALEAMVSRAFASPASRGAAGRAG
ncbi:MAG: ferrochelatase [Verrucomicrobia bacterium]|nr:ferrochelatase [Verrucomicrobiota bacterium]